MTGDEAEDLSSLGFFDLSIAAPSMKAALRPWSADSNPFRQGAAKETDDPKDGKPVSSTNDRSTDRSKSMLKCPRFSAADEAAGKASARKPKDASRPDCKAPLAYEREEKRNAADFNSLDEMGLSRGADMIIEVDSLLAKCPRCGAWPMAANFLKGGSPQQKIRFQCAKCRYVGGGHLRRTPAVQRASENAQG